MKKTTAIILATAIAVAAVPAVPASADPSSEELYLKMQEEQGNLEELRAGEQEAQEALDASRSDLDAKRAEIDRLNLEITGTEDQLTEARSKLAASVRNGYKAGAQALPLTMLLNAGSLGNAISLSYYSSKVSDAQADEVKRISDLEESLNQMRDEAQAWGEEYERLVAQGEQSLEEANRAVEESAANVAELDSRYREVKRAEESAIAAAIVAKTVKASYKASGATQVLDGDTVEEIVWSHLKAQGFSDVAAAAVMGNIYGECGFQYWEESDMDGMFHYAYERAFGLFQFTHASNSAPPHDGCTCEYCSYKRWAGDDYTSLYKQLEWVFGNAMSGQANTWQSRWLMGRVGKYYGDSNIPSSAYTAYEFPYADDIAKATYSWMACYEGPMYNQTNRFTEQRLDPARYYYALFAGSDENPDDR